MRKLNIISILLIILLSVTSLSFGSFIFGNEYEINNDIENLIISRLQSNSSISDSDIIEKIKNGDGNVLRFIDYEDFKKTHLEIIKISRNQGISYYEAIGYTDSIPAFIGGLDNTDSYVKLKCIGFLGNWTDEIGLDLRYIQKRVRDRIVSDIERSGSVIYALKVLDNKITRKVLLNKIYNGDELILQNVTPKEFITLIHNDIFFREVNNVDPRYRIRSIRLAPWWIDMKVLSNLVALKLRHVKKINPAAYELIYGYHMISDEPYNLDILNTDEEVGEVSVSSGNYVSEIESYRPKIMDDPLDDGIEFETLQTYYFDDNNEMVNHVGYRDHAGNWDIQSLYDIRYFEYSEDGKQFYNEDKYVRAIFAGLNNSSSIVKENCARILNMMSDPFIAVNHEGQIVGSFGILRYLSSESKYIEWLINAWEDVRFSQYIDVGRPIEGVDTDYDGSFDDILQYNNDGIKTRINDNNWGYLWNYRIDIYSLIKRMGLGSLLEEDYYYSKKDYSSTSIDNSNLNYDSDDFLFYDRPVWVSSTRYREDKNGNINTFFVESLFNENEIDVMDIGFTHSTYISSWDLVPDWQGIDEIE
jgi:hypothetical protein